MTGIFAEAAPEYHDAGCVVVPMARDGKLPLVQGWAKWRRQRPETVAEFAQAMPDANVGVATGKPSGVTVVDVDDPAGIPLALRRFGDTPLQARTPSGGAHLFYRHRDERSSVRPIADLAVDVRGRGGLIIAPPSVRPGVGVYERIAGTLDDLADLPPINADALPNALERATGGDQGKRNPALFRHALHNVRACDDLDTLVDVLRTRNLEFMPPLGDDEVLKVARSAWKLEQEGRNWLGQEARAVHSRSQTLAILSRPHGADALALDTVLQQCHGARNEPFRLVTKAMERDQVILGWTWRRYQRAIDTLLDLGRLRHVRGVGRPGSPREYLLGAISAPNLTKTPSPHSQEGTG